MSIRLLVVDDHAIIRESMCALFSKRNDLEVVAVAGDGREAVDLVQELFPDVVIMDVVMPRLNGIEATRLVCDRSPEVKVIALSMYSQSRFIADMLCAGASGYVSKECLFEELIHAIEVVTEGSRYLSPKITGAVIEEYLKHASANENSPLSYLTDREQQVLKLVADGKSIQEIATELQVSNKSIEADRRNIMAKLDIHSIAELTKCAILEGLCSL